jgi:hypothetical protein
MQRKRCSVCLCTTLEIRAPLRTEAKSVAAQQGLSREALVEEARRERRYARCDGCRVIEALLT